MATYKFASLIEVDKEFKISGVNIWNHYWNCSDRKIEVRGPFVGNIYFFNEYQIRTPEKTVTFVAGEFSTGQIGIYLREEETIVTAPSK